MASRIQPRIVAAGIELFADLGYFGVTTRDLAKRAKTTEGSIYRLFKTKEGLFAEALKVVIDRALDPAKFLLMLFEQERDAKQDMTSIITGVMQQWYNSIPQKSARLLTQAYFVQPKLRQITVSPYAPIDKIIEILETTITRAQKGHTPKVNAKIAATALILALLNFKITYAISCSSKQEAEMVESFLETWLYGVFPRS
jgi:AcrR family transcriptional regulator